MQLDSGPSSIHLSIHYLSIHLIQPTSNVIIHPANQTSNHHFIHSPIHPSIHPFILLSSFCSPSSYRYALLLTHFHLFKNYIVFLLIYPELLSSTLFSQVSLTTVWVPSPYPNSLKVESVSSSFMSDSLRPWTVAHQAPQSMEFSRQEYWSGLPFPSPGDLPDPEIEPMSPALEVESSLSE